jgi:hypothetical protein
MWSTIEWKCPGSPRRKKFIKWHHLLARCWPPSCGTCWVCYWWISCNMDTQLMLTGIVPWWKACERPSRENVPIFLVVVWVSSMTMIDHTWHSRLAAKIQLGNTGPSHQIVWIWHPVILIFPAMKEHFSEHHFICDEGVKCAAIAWLMQQGHTFYACGMDKPYAVTSVSSIKGTVLKNNIRVTSLLCIVIFFC